MIAHVFSNEQKASIIRQKHDRKHLEVLKNPSTKNKIAVDFDQSSCSYAGLSAM
jgi:hypothetical protein